AENLEGCLRRARGSVDVEPRVLRGHSSPDARLRALRAAKLRRGRPRRGREDARPVGPAPLLDAGDREGGDGLGRDQRRALDDAVLLGADELLALVQEDGLVELVVEGERLDGARLAQLAHRRTAGERLVEADVLERRRRAGDERKYGESAEVLRLA